MKQLLFLSVLTLLGGVAALQTPFWGVLLYYTFAVLRPQYLWEWALPVEVRWSLIAALIVLVAVAVNFTHIFKHGRLNKIVGLMVLYGLLLLLSMLTAFNPAIAQAWGVEYAKIMLIAVIASFVITRLSQVRLLALMIALCLGYIAWEINYMYLFQGHRLDIYHRGYGGLDNNGAGLMIAMGIPFAYALAAVGLHKARWQYLIGGGLLGACMVHAVMMSYSRGAMLAAIVGVAWLIFQHRPRYQAVGIALVLSIAVSVMAGDQIRERFMSTTNFSEDTSAQSRLDSWAAAWQITWEHPLLGKGIRNSNQFTRNYGADYQGRTIHNQYLQIAADSGIPAAGVYLLMLGTALWSLGRCRKRCLAYLVEQESDEVHQAEKICLATQASLLIFATDGVFLSLEMFELPWLLIVMAGVMPGVMAQHLERAETLTNPDKADDRPAHNPAHVSGVIS